MKSYTQIVAILLLIVLTLSLSGCGNSNSINTYSSKTTLEDIEKNIGYADEKHDIENGYSWLGYDAGTLFCGINCSELEFYLTLDNKTLTEIYFESVYEKSNADSVDGLIKDLTKKLGTPRITKNTGSFGGSYGGGSYTEYEWDNDSYIIIRSDGVVLGDIIIAVDKMSEAYSAMSSGDYYTAICKYAELDNIDGVKAVLENIKYGSEACRVAIMSQKQVAILRLDKTINQYWIHYYDFELNTVHGVLCDYDLFEKAAPNDAMSGRSSADIEILYLFDIN